MRFIFCFFAVKLTIMIAASDIKITPIIKSKLETLKLDNIPFGKVFSDYMLECDYVDGVWQTPEIKPYQPLQLEPSLAAIHYGQSIFEGVKAYRGEDGEVSVFRPYDNFIRFNLSAERMAMPTVPEEIFMGGMKAILELEKSWVPAMEDHSLYIRPFMFSTDPVIGVKPSDSYKFMIILSPTGPYYNTPMRIYVEEHYVRAVPGGIGYAKAAGNYAGAMFATAEAKKIGYDQVLWTDAFEHKYVQECGTMNVFFIIGNQAITPSLELGTILAGVTRASVLELLADAGLETVERRITIDEIIDAHKAGTLREVFGSGTAATISMIKELRYREYTMTFDVDNWTVAPTVKKALNDIRYGHVADEKGWMMKID